MSLGGPGYKHELCLHIGISMDMVTIGNIDDRSILPVRATKNTIRIEFFGYQYTLNSGQQRNAVSWLDASFYLRFVTSCFATASECLL